MANIKTVFSILLVFMFMGCGVKPSPRFPKFNKIETLNLSWEDMVFNGEKGHFLMPREWQKIQEALINRRIKANSCISAGDIINKSMVK